MIYVPASSIAAIKVASPGNASVCVKILYKGFEISISSDSSHSTTADLTRSDLRIFTPTDDKDVTRVVWPEFNGHDVEGTAENLRDTFTRIDALLSRLKLQTYGPLGDYISLKNVHKLDKLDPEKVFTLFWKTGVSTLITGPSFVKAWNNAGLSVGSLVTFDWYEQGDARSRYTWDKETRAWSKVGS